MSCKNKKIFSLKTSWHLKSLEQGWHTCVHGHTAGSLYAFLLLVKHPPPQKHPCSYMGPFLCHSHVTLPFQRKWSTYCSVWSSGCWSCMSVSRCRSPVGPSGSLLYRRTCLWWSLGPYALAAEKQRGIKPSRSHCMTAPRWGSGVCTVACLKVRVQWRQTGTENNAT